MRRPPSATAVEREVGELGAVDRPGDRVVALLEPDELVGEDPVGLPGQQRRARPAAAVQVDARLLADLVRLPVGQQAELRLVLLARDRQVAVGDDRVAEAVGPRDADDVVAPLLVVDLERDRRLAGLRRRSLSGLRRPRARWSAPPG